MESEIPGEIKGDEEEGALGLEYIGEVKNVVSVQDITILLLGILARNAL